MRPMDSHTHYYWDDPQYAVSQLDRYQYSHLTILGLPGDLLSNIQAMMAKNARPEQVFTFGCLMYAEGLQPTPESHKAQLQMLMDAGFDGWKIIETKPTTYTAVGRIPLDSDIFEPAFALAEEKQFPITWHCGDPATFWDEEACLDWAKENGWFGASGYTCEFARMPYAAFLPILQDEDFQFVTEEELPEGYRPGELYF